MNMLWYQRYKKLYGEWYIVENAKNSERFFSYLFDHYYDILFFYFLKKWIDDSWAEDLVSLTFMSIAEKIIYVDAKKWWFIYRVLRIANNHYLNFIKTRKNHYNDVINVENIEDIIVDFKSLWPEEYANNTYILQYIVDSSDELSKREKMVFDMVYIDLLPISQIATLLWIEEVSVRSMISKMNKKLRLELQHLIM